MATITKGILGGFSGTVGTIVGANYRGKDIIRSRPKPSSRLPTTKQLVQQAKFRLVVSFLQPLKGIQNKYFGAKSGSRSRTNMATAYTLNNAVQLTLDVPSLIFNKVLITKGDLAAFQNPVANPIAGQKIDFAWEDNSMQGNADETDAVNVVCYSAVLDSFSIYTGVATRVDRSTEIALPDYYASEVVHVWVYMNNPLETIACNSSYLGALTIL